MSMQIAQESEFGRRISKRGQVLEEAKVYAVSQCLSIQPDRPTYLICILEPGSSIPGCQENRGCLSIKQAFPIVGWVPAA